MVFNNNLLLGAGGQGGAAAFDTTLIGNSVWLDGSADDLDRSTTSHSSTECVMSCWFQLTTTSTGNIGLMGLGTGTSGSTNAGLWISANKVYMYNVGHGLQTTQVLRDIGWYHILGSWKLDESTASNKGKLFINGEEVTSFAADPRSSWGTSFGSTATQSVGSIFTNTFLNGYIAQAVMLDGQSIQGGDVAITDFVDTFTFGTNGSQIIPKADADIAALATTAGGNSFCLDFSTASVALSSGVTPTSNAGTVSGSLSNLTDGDFTTEWRSDVDPATNVSNDHVAFDLGSAKDVKAVKITGRASVTGNYKVQFSDNGSDFTDTGTTFSNVSITTTANSGILDLTSDNPGSHRYWKLINISNSSGTSGWGFREIILDSAVGNLGTDASGNGNDLTPNSISSVNQSISTPSKTYSVFNPNAKRSSAFTLSNGNRTAVTPGTDQWIKTTIPFVMSGSNIIRAEFTFDSVGQIGVGITGSLHTTGTYYTNTAAGRGEVALFTNSGALGLVVDGNFNNPAFGGSDGLSNGDIVDVFVNCDVGAVYFAVNGTIKGGASQSDIQNGVTTNAAQAGGSFVRRTAGEVFNFYIMQVNPSAGTITANTGQTAFTHSYSSITSLTSLNTADLTAPDYQGIDYFDSTIYEGNGTGQRVGDFVPFTDAYTVTNSVMFDDGDSRSLTLNSSATRTSATVAAFSLWTKRANLGTNQRPLTVQVDGSNYFSIYYNTSDQLDFTINNGGSTILQRITTRVFKDNSAWHNIVVIINQGESTQADRVKVFYDGVQIPNDSTGFGTNTCTLDGSSALNFLDSASAVHDVGGGSSTGFTQPYDGYVSEVAFLDGADSGAKLNASDFGQLDTSTNRWVPKDIGSYDFGNTGYYLEFKVAPGTGNGAGTDTSGESNNFTSNGSWATTDQFTDCPSQNYPIFSLKNIGSATSTLTEGNLKYTNADNGGFPITMQPTSGKWYFEIELDTAGSFYPGLFTAAGLSYTGISAWAEASSFVYLVNNSNGAVYNGSTIVNGYNTGAMSNGDRLAIAWDVDNNLIYFGLASGGSTTFFSSGDPAAGTGAAPFDLPNERLYFGVVSGGTSSVATHHFISSGWEGAAPTGFSELNQDNLDDTASKITAWAWIKNRDATDSHMLIDRVRGVGVEVHTDGTTTTPETTNTNTVQRFLQRGVQVGNDVQVNTANESYVLWQWLVGDSATTGTTNENGSLDSTVIAADAGHFSVVSWTGNETAGATVGHGLGGTPDFIMAIARAESGENKPVYHTFMTADTDHLKINEANGQSTAGTTIWDVSAMSSTLIGLGAAVQSNSNNGMIAYCFRSVPGVCKVGQYVGNGDGTGSDTVDGPYVSCGFKPRWIMFKWVSGGSLSGEGWVIKDTARQTFNPNDDADIYANFTTAENAGATHGADILSDGFKIRGGGGAVNKSGATYLYVAMAEIGGNGTLPPIYGR